MVKRMGRLTSLPTERRSVWGPGESPAGTVKVSKFPLTVAPGIARSFKSKLTTPDTVGPFSWTVAEAADMALEGDMVSCRGFAGTTVNETAGSCWRPDTTVMFVVPGVAFGEHGEGYVRIAMVENEQRIRQAARGVRRFLESGLETLHNVVPLANRR